jgi:hypothetical protein
MPAPRMAARSSGPSARDIPGTGRWPLSSQSWVAVEARSMSAPLWLKSAGDTVNRAQARHDEELHRRMNGVNGGDEPLFEQ